MQPKSKKKLQLARETLRSLTVLRSDELGKIVGGVSIATQCNSKDHLCTVNTGGTTCNDTTDPDCDSNVTCASQVQSCGC